MNASILTITPRSLQAMLADRRCVALIDVRTAAEYAAGHIPGAISVPLAEFRPDSVIRRTRRCRLGREETAVLTCHAGPRAEQAARRLLSAGYNNVMLLDGGTEAWDRQGLPMRRSGSTLALEQQVQIATGTLVLLQVSLGFALHELFFALAALLGVGLIVAGASRWTGPTALLARMPWNRPAREVGDVAI